MQMKTEYSEIQMRQIGERIKFARRARGLNQGQLCDRAHIPSIKVVSKFELGLDVPRGERLENIAKALGVTTNYILEGEGMSMSSTVVKKPVVSVIPAINPKTEELFDTLKEIEEKEKEETAAEEKEEVKEEPKEVALRLYWQVVKEAKKISRSKYVYMIPAAINDLKAKHNVTNKDLAELVGVTPTGLANNFQGKARINPKYILTIAEFCGVDPDILVDFDRTKNEKPHYENNIKHMHEVLAKKINEQKDKAVKFDTPIMVTTDDVPVPENAEICFAKNAKYYISEMGITPDKVESECGCDIEFFDDVIKHNYKIPLGVLIKVSRLLGKRIEDLTFDNVSMRIEAEIAEYEEKIRALKKKIGC